MNILTTILCRECYGRFSNVIHIEKKSYTKLSLIKHSWLFTIRIIRTFASVFFSSLLFVQVLYEHTIVLIDETKLLIRHCSSWLANSKWYSLRIHTMYYIHFIFIVPENHSTSHIRISRTNKLPVENIDGLLSVPILSIASHSSDGRTKAFDF